MPLLAMAADHPAESVSASEGDDAAFVLGGDHRIPVPGHEVVARLPRSSEGFLRLYTAGLKEPVRVRRTGVARAVGVLHSGTVEYRGDGVDADALVFEAAGTIEELVIVRRAGTLISYELQLPAGASMRSVNASTVEIRRGDADWLRLSADRAWDADGARFQPTLQLQGNRVALTLPQDVRLPAVVDPSWENSRRMQQPRLRHAAALLPSGKVLVAGGCTEFECEGEGPTATAEVYDPLTGTFSNTGAMAKPRHSFSMTALPSGRVLVAGGCQDKTCDKADASAELYDPSTGEFSLLTSTMSSVRWKHTATRLASGQVLIAGGSSGSATNSELATAELFDPAGAGTFTPVAAMSAARASHTATLLRNGKVLIAGGTSSGSSLQSAELYDPAGKAFAPSANLAVPRAWHTSTGLPDGTVLIAGGCNGSSCSSHSLQTAERFDPAGNAGAGTFKTIAANLAVARRRHSATLLPTGKVLLVAGCVIDQPCWSADLTRSAELFDPVTETFQITPQPDGMRRDFTATVLSSGRVLIAGGSGGGMALKASELFDPVGLDATVTTPAAASPSGSITFSKMSLAKGRLGQSATLLQDGKVLVVGGIPCTDASNPLVCGLPIAAAELYDFKTDTVTTSGAAKTPRLAAYTTVLSDGKALVIGGCDNGGCTAQYGFKGALDSLEVFDPTTGAFTLVQSKMSVVRTNVKATLLSDGRVLISGGCTQLQCSEGGTEFRDELEVYDPSDGSVQLVGKLARARAYHSATVLDSGKILFAGGRDYNGSVDVSEILDPQTMTLTLADSTIVPRTAQAAVLMPTGAVLLAGGLGASGLSSFTSTSEYYQPLGTSSLIPPMKQEHFWPNPPGAVQLPTGKIALFGGWAVTTYSGTDASPTDPDKKRAAEVFDPIAGMGVGAFAYAGMMQEARTVHSVTRLPSGKVLMLGGCQTEDLTGTCHNNQVSATLELYHDGLVADGAWRPTVVAPSTAIATGSTVQLTGTGFTGIPGGGSGTSSDSESGHPVALWLPDSGGYPLSGEVTGWTDTSFTWKAPLTARLGPGWLHVVVQGTASLGVPVRLSAAAQAAPCNTGMQCLSGFCADGVCCNSACGAPCNACTAVKKGGGQDGECGPVADSTDPDSDCEQQQFSTCGNDGECDGAGACRKYKSGLQCTEPSCVLGNLTPAGTCNGAGSCVSSQIAPCFPFLCDAVGKACSTSCSKASECAAGAVCVAGTCLAPIDNGSPCVAPEACKSGQCVKGVCCDAAACFPFSCDATGCKTACVDNSDCATSARCDVPSKNCVSGAACADSTTAVDSQGKSVPCSPYQCKAGQCGTRCTVSADCVPGFTCDRASGTCVQPEQPVAEDQGCSCSAAGLARRSGAAWTLALALGGALLGRRRRRAWILPIVAFLLFAASASQAADPPSPAGSSSQALPAPAAPPGSAGASAPDVEAAKEKAKARFVRGLELVQNEAWDAALAEFLASREIYATRVAVKNAAMCLRQLNRSPDALAMYQELVQRFGSNLSADEKRMVDDAIAQLRERVGEIVVATNVQGATVIVGGKERGKSPIADPVVVDVGTHTVRVFKEGYLPFEAQVAVAGKQRKSVQATMQALAASGTLAVAEAEGGKFQVVVDGAEMGNTPWTGTLAIGFHVVILRGEGAMGTPPSAVTVESNRTTRLTLRAVRLDAELRVEPTPSNARVDIDGVTVGNGVWEGRLGSGTHRVEVTSEGFLAWRKDITLGARREVQRVVLDRDLSDPRWREAFRGYPYVEALVGGAIAPSFGGSMDSACSKGDCSERTRPWGFVFGARAGYQVASAVGIELMAGYLRLSGQATRKATATADFPSSSTDYHETTLLTGAIFGAAAAVRPLRDQPLLARLSVGVMRARATFTNEGTFSGGSPTPVSFRLSVPESGEDLWVPWVGPEVRYGYRVSKSFVVDFGIALLVMFPPETLRKGRTPRDLERGVRSQVVPDVTLPDSTVVRPGTAVLDREHGFGTFLCILPTLGGRWDL